MEISSSNGHTPLSREGQAWKAAQKLEASFLTEMLKSAGLGETKSDFGGGEGEAQFASFMRDAQAQRMVEAGGIGLTEVFFNKIMELDNGKDTK